MSIVLQAKETVDLVGPYLPTLMTAAATTAGTEAIKGIPAIVKNIWALLGGKVKDKESTKRAAEDVVADPKDEDNVASFRKELRELLKENPDIAANLATLLASPEAAEAKQTITVMNSTLQNSPIIQQGGSGNKTEMKNGGN
jgi:hypothetical protein